MLIQNFKNELSFDQSKFNKNISNNFHLLSKKIPDGIYLAETEKDIRKVQELRKEICDERSDHVYGFQKDGFDSKGYLLYSEDEWGEIGSTSRLLLDSPLGFPDEEKFPDIIFKLRSGGKKIAQLGRLGIISNKVKNLRIHYKAIFEIAKFENIDCLIIVMKTRNVSSHKKIMSIKVLSNDMGLSWDKEKAPLCLVSWDISAHQPFFQKWINKEKRYSIESWDKYSAPHLAVLTSVQHEVYSDVAKKMTGNVLDAGCGSGRVTGFIKENLNVQSYTGVDFSEGMIKQAKWLSVQLNYKARFIQAGIEDVTGTYDSILSINSYFSWMDPIAVLSHLHNLLLPSGTLVLVTPSNEFDVEKLTAKMKQELLGHPFYKQFMEINNNIASNSKGLFLPMDELIDQVRKVGFKVVSCHSHYYLGGVNYLQLTKV